MMDAIDYQLIETLQKGLAICSRPYLKLGQLIDLSEQEVIDRLTQLRQQGVIKRLGVIVNHRQLGYRANAMVVVNIPDNTVDLVGAKISQFSYVNLCYQRPRQDEEWPYNLYFMIHGKTQEKVLSQLDALLENCGLQHIAKEVLFSQQCFKQRGAIYKAIPENQLEVECG